MNISLFINLSDNRNMTKSLTGEKTYDCTIKRETGVVNPVIMITSTDDLRGYNYVYVPLYKRYYYASVTVGPNNVYTFNCNVDVLMSYKSQVLPKQAIIKRSASLYNLYMPDNNFYISSKVRRQIKTFSGGFDNSALNYVVATV